jgi:hypothetical protein
MQLHRDMSMATTGTGNSYMPTAQVTPSGRAKTAHHRAQSAANFSTTVSGPFMNNQIGSMTSNRLNLTTAMHNRRKSAAAAGQRDHVLGEMASSKGLSPGRALSCFDEHQKRRSVPTGFTGTKYTGANGHRRMQSALIVGTKINSVGCTMDDVKGKTPKSVRAKRVRGKLSSQYSFHNYYPSCRLRPAEGHEHAGTLGSSSV